MTYYIDQISKTVGIANTPERSGNYCLIVRTFIIYDFRFIIILAFIRHLLLSIILLHQRFSIVLFFPRTIYTSHFLDPTSDVHIECD